MIPTINEIKKQIKSDEIEKIKIAKQEIIDFFYIGIRMNVSNNKAVFRINEYGLFSVSHIYFYENQSCSNLHILVIDEVIEMLKLKGYYVEVKDVMTDIYEDIGWFERLFKTPIAKQVPSGTKEIIISW